MENKWLVSVWNATLSWIALRGILKDFVKVTRVAIFWNTSRQLFDILQAMLELEDFNEHSVLFLLTYGNFTETERLVLWNFEIWLKNTFHLSPH